MAQDISEFHESFVDFFKHREQDKVWWTGIVGDLGFPYFSFDKKTIYNLGVDYPYNLTTEQKKIFDEENPYWRDFFAWRCE